MKKILLSIVFICTTSTIINANSTINKINNDYCFEQMLDAYEFMVAFTGDVQLASNTAEGVFNICEENVDAIPGYYN